MLDKLISKCIEFRGFVLILFGLIAVASYFAVSEMTVDAIPDIGENQRQRDMPNPALRQRVAPGVHQLRPKDHPLSLRRA